MLRHANLLVSILFDAINEVRDASERCKADKNEPGIIASTPGRVRGSVRSLTTASRKSRPPVNRPLPVAAVAT